MAESLARASFDPIRSLAAGSISGTYASVGTPTTKRVRGICFTNTTQGDMMFTDDITQDKVLVPAGSFKLWDIQANMNAQKDDAYVIQIGTQWSVKQIEAPVDGSVYIEMIS